MPGSCWDGRGGVGLPESCRSCRVFCASCLRLIGLLGLNIQSGTVHLGCLLCLCLLCKFCHWPSVLQLH